MISGRKVLAKKQSVTAETRRRAQQALLDPGKGRRRRRVAKLPQDQEPEALREPLRRHRMDAGGNASVMTGSTDAFPFTAFAQT
jgi:hypothetical protein